MSYRFLAPVYDWVAPHLSRYRSPALLTSKVLALAPEACELLDIGVGTGLSIAPYVTASRFKRIVGLDPSAPMLARCRRRFPSVELHEGTLDVVQSRLGSPFDIVQSMWSGRACLRAGGFPRPRSSGLEVGRILRLRVRAELLFSRRQSKPAPHIGTFGRGRVFRRTPHEVQVMLRDSGLAVCEDLEFKAYLGLVHHLVVARCA